MQAINSMRHTAIYNPETYADKRVALIGVGTIGSWLALTLARMQVPLALYDNDGIEAHNLATQAYTTRHAGRKKVAAIASQINELAEGLSIEAIPEHYTGQRDKADIFVSCVDSIDARREIAQAMIAREYDKPIIDGRVGAEQLEVYYFTNPSDWLAQLPAAADDDPCGARFTAYTAVICAGIMAAHVKALLVGKGASIPPRIIADLASYTFLVPKAK